MNNDDPLFQTHDQRALDLIRRMRTHATDPFRQRPVPPDWTPDTLIPLGTLTRLLTVIIGLADLDCVCPQHMIGPCPGHDCDACPTCLSGEARRLLTLLDSEG